jgi:hypothetical protein
MRQQLCTPDSSLLTPELKEMTKLFLGDSKMSDAVWADLDELLTIIDEAVGGFTSFTVKAKQADGLLVQSSGRWYKITIVPRAAPKAKKAA